MRKKVIAMHSNRKIPERLDTFERFVSIYTILMKIGNNSTVFDSHDVYIPVFHDVWTISKWIFIHFGDD